ncbi:hypothetical protein [Streptomyces sp. NPDC020362]|uniref:hypothetical protein n=1 Tax=unclassified Streptomyces TaxID=2593676 RepID=UPI0033D82E02
MNAHRETPHAHRAGATSSGKLRMRYAAIGIFMAFTWIGEGKEPAWEHALRALVILLILPPLLLWTHHRLTHKLYETDRPAQVVAQLITARTVIITADFGTGILLGHLLDPHSGRSMVLPAIGLLLLVLSIPAQIRRARRTRAGTSHPSTRPALSAPRLMAAKLILLSGALLAQLLLSACLDDATFVVAAAIVVTAAALGPAVHRRLLVTGPATADEEMKRVPA